MQSEEFIPAERLQKLLREFGGGLADVEVQCKSALLTPHKADIVGTVWIHGKPLTFHVEDYDLTKIRGVQDVLGLAGQLLESFEEAARQPS